jgi:hypothetical protein
MAIISPKLNILFIEVPCTESTSLRTAIKYVDSSAYNVSPRYGTAKEIRNKLDPKLWDSLEKIGFIRHPEDWLKSISSTIIMSKITKGRTPMDWFIDDKGEIIIDKIYKTEDMNNFMTVNKLPVQKLNESNKLISLVGTKHRIKMPEMNLSRELEFYKPDAPEVFQRVKSG